MRIPLVAAVLAITGCSATPDGGQQTVSVTSQPPGAACTVRRGTALLGTVDPTPGTLIVGPSERDLLVSCSKPGFGPGTATVKAIYKGVGFGALLTGGTAAVVESAVRGTDFRYDPAGATVVLPPG